MPRSFVFFRITLPMLMPYIITASLFRLLDSIQQFDIIYAMTQGGPGDTLMVFQVQAYLEFFQYTNVGRSAALLMILWAITYVALEHLHQAMAAAARTRARPGVRSRSAAMEHDNARSGRIFRGVALALILVLLPVPDLLDLPDVVPDQRADPAHPAAASFFAPTLANYTALISGQAGDRGRHSRHRLHAQSLEQRRPVERRSVAARAAARRAGGLRLRPLQVPAGRGHRLHAAVVPLRAAAARAAAARRSISSSSASPTPISA